MQASPVTANQAMAKSAQNVAKADQRLLLDPVSVMIADQDLLLNPVSVAKADLLHVMQNPVNAVKVFLMHLQAIVLIALKNRTKQNLAMTENPLPAHGKTEALKLSRSVNVTSLNALKADLLVG